MDEIVCKLDEKPCNQMYLKALVNLHNVEIQTVSKLTNEVDAIYERGTFSANRKRWIQ